MAGVLALCLAPAIALALMVPFSLDRLVTDADTIVHGSVVRRESRWDTSGRLIVTDVTLDVSETLKGEPAVRQTLRIAGGTVGEVTLTMSEVPEFRDGEDVIVFLAHDQVPSRVVGLWQGKFTVEGQVVERGGRRLSLADFLDEIARRSR